MPVDLTSKDWAAQIRKTVSIIYCGGAWAPRSASGKTGGGSPLALYLDCSAAVRVLECSSPFVLMLCDITPRVVCMQDESSKTGMSLSRWPGRLRAGSKNAAQAIASAAVDCHCGQGDLALQPTDWHTPC